MNKSSGIGLWGIVFVVFLVLKLCGKIDWSWWWITAPLWGPPLAIIAIMIIIILIVAMVKLIMRAFK